MNHGNSHSESQRSFKPLPGPGHRLAPKIGITLREEMRILARSVLVAFASEHPTAEPSLTLWHAVAKAATWISSPDVQAAFTKVKVLNDERVRFEIADGSFRMVAFDFRRRIAFVKFVGTYAEYDRIDTLTVALF